MGTPATCKNCLSVGASENNNPDDGLVDGNVASFSSQGPVPISQNGQNGQVPT